MIKEQPEQPDQPDRVVQVIVTDLNGKEAYGFTNADGERVVTTDHAFLANDRSARESAFRAFVLMAS